MYYINFLKIHISRRHLGTHFRITGNDQGLWLAVPSSVQHLLLTHTHTHTQAVARAVGAKRRATATTSQSLQNSSLNQQRSRAPNGSSAESWRPPPRSPRSRRRRCVVYETLCCGCWSCYKLAIVKAFLYCFHYFLANIKKVQNREAAAGEPNGERGCGSSQLLLESTCTVITSGYDWGPTARPPSGLTFFPFRGRCLQMVRQPREANWKKIRQLRGRREAQVIYLQRRL